MEGAMTSPSKPCPHCGKAARRVVALYGVTHGSVAITISRGNGMMEMELAGGHFEAEVAGDVEFTMHGAAVFDISPNARGRNILLIALRHDTFEGDGDHSITISNALSEVPPPSRFRFGDMGRKRFVGTYEHVTEGGRSGVYAADSGQLVISSSSPVEVCGSFEFVARGSSIYVLFAEEAEVRVHGRFRAKRVADAYALLTAATE
jgi:hypothetical protein